MSYHMVEVTNATYEKLGKPNELSIKELIQNQKLIFGYVKGGSYYPIDMSIFKDKKMYFQSQHLHLLNIFLK